MFLQERDVSDTLCMMNPVPGFGAYNEPVSCRAGLPFCYQDMDVRRRGIECWNVLVISNPDDSAERDNEATSTV